MSSSIFTEVYSDKSFVIRGDTTRYKEDIKSMGGKWNSRLKEKNSEDKFGAWLFWNDKRAEVDEWFKKGFPGKVKNRQPILENNFFSSSQSLNRDSQNTRYIQNLEDKVDRLSIMIESLCSFHKIVVPELVISSNDKPPLFQEKKYNLNQDVESLIDEENNTKTHKRLLSRKNLKISPAQ